MTDSTGILKEPDVEDILKLEPAMDSTTFKPIPEQNENTNAAKI